MLDETVVRPPTPLGARMDGDVRWYHPSRDLSVIGPELLRSVFVHFETVPHPEPYYADILGGLSSHWPLSEDEQRKQLGEAARMLAKFIIVSFQGEHNSITTAAEEAGGLNTLDPRIRTAVFARLGEVLLGCIYACMKDITPVGGEPPHAKTLEQILLAAEAFAAKIAVPPKKPWWRIW